MTVQTDEVRKTPNRIINCPAPTKDDTGKATPCGQRRRSNEQCPNRGEHIMPLKTGFCSNGNCEGTNKRSPSGRTMKTCEWWKTCPCECHLMYDRMFSETGMPRTAVDNSGYVPEHGGFVMPERVVEVAPSVLSNPDPAPVRETLQSAAPGIVPPDAVRSFGPTNTGRAARGELEAWVKAVTDEWVVEQYPFPCTPTYVAEEIAKTHGINPPSTGAISAVWDRWVKLEFAVTDKKPSRFVGYTDEAIKVGLDAMKERAKRATKSIESARKRGLKV